MNDHFTFILFNSTFVLFPSKKGIFLLICLDLTTKQSLPVKHYISKIDLTHPKQLKTLVENRSIFNLERCELNVFESYLEAFQVPLTFNDLVITSMVRGKKVMHLPEKPSFDYIPGETVIVGSNETMVIDFPEATIENPTQCIALAVDNQYIKQTVDYLNNYYNSDKESQTDWDLAFNHYHFENDNEVSGLINKLIRICRGSDITKDIFADLSLKELLIRLLQSQHLYQVAESSSTQANKSRQHQILNFINHHLTEQIIIDDLSKKAHMCRNDFFKWFKQQFGITPLDYINRERIKLAKRLLNDTNKSITAISYECGFSDVNYFVRLFKSKESITPGKYRECIENAMAI